MWYTRCASQSFFSVVQPDHSVLFGSSAFELSLPVNQALDLPDFPSQLRRKCLGGLCWICGRHALLPKSLRIPFCYNQIDTPLYCGGFGDVWKGEHQGCHVAVKVLRVYSTSDFGKVTSVSPHDPLKLVR